MIKCTSGESAMERICEFHSGVNARMENLEESDKLQWEAIEKIKDRIPVWGTLLISVLTFALGASLTYASLAIKITELAARKP
jgi:hypothetical protein